MPKNIPTKLSKAAKKRHVDSGGASECPFCHADDMSIDCGEIVPLNEDEWDLEQESTCSSCGRKWVDCFKLVKVFAVDPVKGTRE